MKELIVTWFLYLAWSASAFGQGTLYRVVLNRNKGVPKETAIPFTVLNPLKDMQATKDFFIPNTLLTNLESYTLSRSFEVGSIDNRPVLLPTLLALLKDKSQIVVFDTNLNNNFSDDSVLYQNFPVGAKLSETLREKKITMTITPNKTIDFYFRYTTFKPKGINVDNGDDKENSFFLMIQPFQFFTGEITDINGLITLTDWKHLFKTTDKSLKLYFNKESKKVYQLGDTLITPSGSLVLRDISRFYDTLFLEPLLKKNVIGYNEGYLAPSVVGLDIFGNPIHIVSPPNKYILLDFWGTWCVPCIETIPDLKKIKSHYSDRLEIVGISLDKDIETVRRFVRKKDLPWKQLFQNLRDQTDQKIINDYKIKEYPTSVLIDPSGKIALRISGKNDFHKLEDFLKEKLK